MAALGTGGLAQAFTVPNFSGPGVSVPGYPDFWAANYEGSLTSSHGTFTLSVTGNLGSCNGRNVQNCSAAIFNFPSGAYVVGNESVSITANFSSSGQFLSGSYTLYGSLPASSNPSFGKAPTGYSWSAQAPETLLTANLTADTIDSADGALGFKEVFTGGWADQPKFTGGITTESVWLYSLLSGWGSGDDNNVHNSGWNSFLAELKSGRGLKTGTFVGIASIATVPVPAALLLFGSGLAGLGLLRRRKATQPVTA